MELRLLVETWEEYRDGQHLPIKNSETVLQFREMKTMIEGEFGSDQWTDWQDVPTVYEDK